MTVSSTPAKNYGYPIKPIEFERTCQKIGDTTRPRRGFAGVRKWYIVKPLG